MQTYNYNKVIKAVTCFVVVAMVFGLGSAMALAQPDQDKQVRWSAPPGWILYYTDNIVVNGRHDPGEAWSTTGNISNALPDCSCWMASTSNLLVNEGFANPYSTGGVGWLGAGGAPSPSSRPWGGGLIYAGGGGAFMTFDDGGWPHWALDYIGVARQGPIITTPEFGGTWSTDPVTWCQDRLAKGHLCGLIVYWGTPPTDAVPGSPPIDPEYTAQYPWGYHNITLVGIEPNSPHTTGTVIITDSDDNLIGASRRCKYTYSAGSNWVIKDIYPYPLYTPPGIDANVNYAVALADVNEPNEPSPMGTAFTYQGRLIDANSAADGLYDFQFKLYDANVAGTQKGSTIDVNEVDVIDGYFTVKLDFGSVFDGNAVWLEIGVRPNGGGGFTTLSPRQEVTPTPYALYAASAGSGGAGSGWIISGNDMYSSVSGNVGIGMASPGRKLDVAGSIRGSELEVKNGWGSIFINNYGGNYDESGYASLIQQAGDVGGLAFLVADSGTAGNPITWTWAMKIDKSGKVGIGTTNPRVATEICGSGYVGLMLANRTDYPDLSGVLYFESPSKFQMIRNRAGALVFETDTAYTGAGTERMRITFDGNVGIGTTAPGSILDVGNYGTTSNVENTIRLAGRYLGANGTFANLRLSNSSDSGGSYLGIVARRESNNYGVSADFTVNNTGAGATPLTAMTLQYNGNVGIGTTNPTYKLAVNGSAAKPGGGSWSDFSDARLKDITGNYEHGLDEVARLNPIRYSYRQDNELNLPQDKQFVGVVAQDVQNVIPEAVEKNSNGYLMVNNDPIIWATVNAIKQLKAENELLRQRLDVLEKTINAKEVQQ